MPLDTDRWVRFSGFKGVVRAIQGLIDLMLSDLEPARSLGSFGCGFFTRGDLAERSGCRALVVS
jgi:hypothetical protein